jgi:CRP/FNR family transcriptional regulator, anaerobic regulatory protein
METERLDKLTYFSEPELKKEIREHGKIVSLNTGDVIVKAGQYVQFLPIVLKGAIRVFQQKEDREILLYYVRPQQTCTMSLCAAYFNNKSTSHGVVIEPADVLIFPARFIAEWQLKYPSWNTFMLQMFRSRYDELIDSFERVVFDPISVRTLEYLKKRAKEAATKTVVISHQNLAYELGTTRVVVSRILKQFEHDKKIRLSRGAITLL